MSSIIKTYIIYIYRNLITGKYVYVGQTFRGLVKRAKKDGTGYKKCSLFWSEIEKYGWQNFEAEVLTTTTDKEYANLLEWFYTIEFDTQYPNGCNDRIGWEHSKRYREEESKKRIGHEVSEETRQKISKTLKGSSMPFKGRVSPVKNKNWYTNGFKNTMQFECPKGFWPGRNKVN